MASRASLRRAVLVTCLSAAALPAQQTIINVPSVDQTPRGRFFALHESQVRTWDPASYWQTTHFMTYGVTDRVEVALTTYNLGLPASRFAAVGLGWKAAQPILRRALPTWELTVGAGQMFPMSLTGRGQGKWSYAQVAARLPLSRTRVMAGASHASSALFGRRTTHMIASFEQPLRGHWQLLGEWWSGEHEFSDFVPGVNYHWDRNVVIVGYKFSNAPGTQGDGLIFEIGRTF